MKSIRTRILFCALLLAIAALPAFAGTQGLPQIAEQVPAKDSHRGFPQAHAEPARRHPARHRSLRRSAHVKVREIEPGDGFEKTPPQPRRVAAKSPNHADSGAIRRAEAREAVERAARTEGLYRASQTNAPIIANATACKRIGAHGESIYENCGTTVAAGADGTR